MLDHGYVATAPDHAGAYDVVGDVHGHAAELFHLLRCAGWKIGPYEVSACAPIPAHHPDNRFLVLTGDLVNHGPDSDLVLRLLAGMRQSGRGMSVMGNHDLALLRELHAKPVKKPKSAVEKTAMQIRAKGPDFAREIIRLLRDMPHQLRLPMPEGHSLAGDGVVSVVHAAALERNLDKSTETARDRAIHGMFNESKGKPRKGPADWADRYHGKRWIIHGHTPMTGIHRRGRVIGIDTAAAKGGQLTMLRLDTVSALSVPMGLAAGLPQTRRATAVA
jgi:protein phosphatase